MSDSGMYTVKVQSKSSIESKTFDLRVGPQKSSSSSIVITRGKLPQNVEKEDADFRNRLKKVQSATKKALSKDNEGVKGFGFMISKVYHCVLISAFYRYIF